MSKNVLSYQISVILLENLQASYDFITFASTVKKHFPELGGYNPMMTPSTPGDNMPPEIPRFIFQTNELTVQASLSRLDVTFQLNGKHVFNSIENSIMNLEKVLNTIDTDLSYRIGVALTIELTKEEIWTSLDKVLKDETLKQKDELQFSYLDNPQVAFKEREITINCWIRYMLVEKLKQYICILDINTPAEKIISLKTNKIGEIYNEILNETIRKKVDES